MTTERSKEIESATKQIASILDTYKLELKVETKLILIPMDEEIKNEVEKPVEPVSQEEVVALEPEPESEKPTDAEIVEPTVEAPVETPVV